MLELGRSGSAGAQRGVRPVLRDGAVVATLRASNWREAATADVGGQPWDFAREARTIVGRRPSEPDGPARLRARPTSWWRGTWMLDLEGTTVDLVIASRWTGTHRYVRAGRTVAESGRTGRWSGRPTLSAAADLPLHHQVFLLWLEVVLQRRDAAAAA